MNDIKKNNIKKIILGSFLGILIGSLLGTTYAMFTFNSSSINNKLIAGDIYMRYKETSAINLNGAMPSATYPTEASGNYFEFQIIGKNTNTTKDITYNVKLAYGDNHATRTTRIDDEYLVFKLVEVVNGEELATPLVNNQSFDTIPGATLYTATIQANTTTESTRTFRVYARISEEVGIGTNTTYTESEWNNLYASVKINVDGGFEISTPTPTPVVIPTMAEMCPNCRFMFTIDSYKYNEDGESGTVLDDIIYDGVLVSSNYEDIINDSGHAVFLGVITSNGTTSGKITRAFACGVEPDSEIPFCIEGYTDDSKQSQNFTFMRPIFGEENCHEDDEVRYCAFGSMDAGSYSEGVYVYSDSDSSDCLVYYDGDFECLKY